MLDELEDDYADMIRSAASEALREVNLEDSVTVIDVNAQQGSTSYLINMRHGKDDYFAADVDLTEAIGDAKGGDATVALLKKQLHRRLKQRFPELYPPTP